MRKWTKKETVRESSNGCSRQCCMHFQIHEKMLQFVYFRMIIIKSIQLSVDTMNIKVSHISRIQRNVQAKNKPTVYSENWLKMRSTLSIREQFRSMLDTEWLKVFSIQVWSPKMHAHMHALMSHLEREKEKKQI